MLSLSSAMMAAVEAVSTLCRRELGGGGTIPGATSATGDNAKPGGGAFGTGLVGNNGGGASP